MRRPTLLPAALCALTGGALAGCPSPPVGPPPIASSEPSPTAIAEEIPRGRLPEDVRPERYRLELTIDPRRKSYRGEVAIDVALARRREILWLHGHGHRVGSVTVTPAGGEALLAHYAEVDPGGVVRLTPARAVGPGKATIRIAFEADFSTKHNALYRVEVGQDRYAFTQMEPVWARHAFPCFDEPAFKTPWEVAVTVPSADKVVANTREFARQDVAGGMQRVIFATTKRLPSYLLAFAVGPLDVVAAPDIPPGGARITPLPFRGVTTRGRGGEIAYALRETPAILRALEDYFAVEYPYDKLDILAVPEKGGAMENAGAVTFREWLLLFPDAARASVQQRRAFAYVMAHELAHQWFGNLVTMPWWDDIWLNEAFATWMGWRVVERVKPEYDAAVWELGGVHAAMGVDGLVSARQIRQPVGDNDAIHAAFDSITYRKGGGVLAMFERWLGPEVFRQGLRQYMQAHRHGTATAGDLLAALSKAAGKDVATPFKSFLSQPGLPLLETQLRCRNDAGRLHLGQSRYLPLGSAGDKDKTWQIPLCVRYFASGGVRETCTLLGGATATLPLEGDCPAWVMPNANAAGYYQLSMAATDVDALMERGLSHMNVRERMAIVSSLRAAYRAGKLDAGKAFEAAARFARDPHPSVAGWPMRFYYEARFWLAGDPLLGRLQQKAGALYRPVLDELGWQPKPDESDERKLLRRDVIAFLGVVAADAQVIAEAGRLARAYVGLGGDGKLHPEAMDANIAGAVLAVAGQGMDAAMFDAILALLPIIRDQEVRANLVGALSQVRDPSLAKRALCLVLDKRLEVTEMLAPLGGQLGHHATRALAYQWVSSHIESLVERLPPRSAGWLPEMIGRHLCAGEDADSLRRLFEKRNLAGGRRNLALALESIAICAARKKQQLPGVKAYLSR